MPTCNAVAVTEPAVELFVSLQAAIGQVEMLKIELLEVIELPPTADACHMVCKVDEINRAMPKTQSALLEAMAEKQVTVEGVTRGLEEPFLVVATENPICIGAQPCQLVSFHGDEPELVTVTVIGCICSRCF